MNILIVYESMYGNTRRVAETLADALTGQLKRPFTVRLRNVNTIAAKDALDADLLIVGAPTHAHGMSQPSSRLDAIDRARDSRSNLRLEPELPGIGVREWLAQLPPGTGLCAAFDTRADIPRLLSGTAARHIDRALRETGRRMLLPPRSFLVATQNTLEPFEQVRAIAWGEKLADALSSRLHPAT